MKQYWRVETGEEEVKDERMKRSNKVRLWAEGGLKLDNRRYKVRD
jgi:hypothetical protein